MPGIEVFTISGVLGAAAPASASPVVRLQNALKALGTTAGDAQLMAIGIDGIVGPQTVKLTNYALANFVGATSGFPGANLNAVKVKGSAAVLADRISARVQQSGGNVPTPPAVVARAKPKPRLSLAPIPTTDIPTPQTDRKWVFWLIGGAGVLILLSAAAAAAKKLQDKHQDKKAVAA